MRTDQDRLTDLVDACQRLRRIIDRGEQHFRSSDEAQLAIVHLVQIMGEAAARVSPELRARHPDVPWREVAAMRNQVVHRYFDIDLDLVWAIGTRDVPRLEQQVRRITDERPEP